MYTIKKQGYGAKKAKGKKQSEPELAGLAHEVFAFFSANKKTAMSISYFLAAALVFAAGYTLYQTSNDKKASALLAQAQEYYTPSPGAQPDYAKALELFGAVHTKYSGTMSGAIARYYAGNCLMGLGRMDEALKEYRQVIKDHSGKKDLIGLVYQRMGYAYSALGKRDEAVKSFERSEAALGPGLATVELARLYEQAGNTAEAQKKYNVIAEKLSGTGWSEEAKKKEQAPVK